MLFISIFFQFSSNFMGYSKTINSISGPTAPVSHQLFGWSAVVCGRLGVALFAGRDWKMPSGKDRRECLSAQ
jgi:hypothetical protein